MTNRTRTNRVPRTQGTRTRFGSPVSDMNPWALVETCADTRSPGDNWDLNISRTTYSGAGVIQSTNPVGYFTGYFQNYMADGVVNGQLAGISSFPGQLPDAAYATQTAARTNPSKPYVDIPVNVLQIGEIVHMLREAGVDLIPKFKKSKLRFHSGNIPRDLGKGNLAYQFGIAPVVGDLIKLFSFKDQLDRRIKEIERLKTPRGFRKTVELDSLTVSNDISVVWQSQDTFMQSNCSVIGNRVIKGHARWLPNVDFSKIPQSELMGMAKRSIHGMTIDFSTLWEILPWSWLFDWGTNLGDYLKSKRNIIPCSLSSISLMKHTINRFEVPTLVSGNNVMKGGVIISENKQRYPVNITPEAHLPFLSAGQMGILSSLAVTRR